MYLNPTFGLLFVATLASASLSLNTAINTKEINSFDKDSKKYAIITTIIAFSVIFIFSYGKLFFSINDDDTVDKYLLGIFFIFTAVCSVISYISYRESNDSHSVNTSSTNNNIERKTIFAAFILSIVAVSICTASIANLLSHHGYLSFFENLFGSKNKPPKEVELQNILNDLEEMTL